MTQCYNKKHKFKLSRVKLCPSLVDLSKMFPLDMESYENDKWYWLIDNMTDYVFAPSNNIVKAYSSCINNKRINQDTIIEIEFFTTFEKLEDLVNLIPEEFL